MGVGVVWWCPSPIHTCIHTHSLKHPPTQHDTRPRHRRQSSKGFYGRGAYFAERAAYSDESYAHETAHMATGAHAAVPVRQLLLCRVLCGEHWDYGTGTDRALVKPPPGCKSVKGGPHRFSGAAREESVMWVVYDLAQVYPQLLVTYTV